MRTDGDEHGSRHHKSLRTMYQQMLAGWTGDLLAVRSIAQWREPDPADDYRNRNWQLLYTGGVLDD